jgi:hypothetical protein
LRERCHRSSPAAPCRSTFTEAAFEVVATEPIAPLAATIACLDRALWAVDDQSADAIDLRLARKPIWLGDGLSQGARTVVRDEVRNDRREHVRMISVTHDRTIGRPALPRRPDPQRINEARRAAIRNVLIDEYRMPAELADTWIASWEAEDDRRGTEPGSDYWTIGLVWIRERARPRRQP